MKTALAVLMIAAFASFSLAARGHESSSDAAARPPAPTPICGHHCHFKRDREALRRKTDRNPIPTYIVSCESGGDYRNYNPTSGAGGKYQVIPSTWRSNLPSARVVRLAEGLETRRQVRRQLRRHGALDSGPQWSSPLLQDIVAASIWAGSGAGAWDCA